MPLLQPLLCSLPLPPPPPHCACATITMSSPCPTSLWAVTSGYSTRMQKVCNVFADKGNPAPPADSWTILQAFIGSFLGILALSGINYHLDVEDSDLVMITGSFGAQAVLVFAAPRAPLAQPWNCMFGSLISSFVGVSMFKLFKEGIQREVTLVYLASALSVSLSIVAMLLTRSLHPPAGATALIAVLGSDKVHHLGYWYVLFPALVASSLHVFLGILLNNLSSSPDRSYPSYWRPIPMTAPSKNIPAGELSNPPPSSPRAIISDSPNCLTTSDVLAKKSGVETGAVAMNRIEDSVL